MSSPKFLPTTPFPDWANDEDFPAGTDPWSGGPTKVEPVGSVRDMGVQPDDQLGGQHYNWLNYRYGAMLRALVHQGMQRWTAHTVAEESSNGPGGYRTGQATNWGTKICAVNRSLGGGLGPPGFHAQRPELAAFGIEAGELAVAITGYGHHWVALDTVPATAVLDVIGDSRVASGNQQGHILATVSDDNSIRRLSNNLSGGWDSVAVGGEGHCYVLHEAGTRILVSLQTFGATTNANRIATSDDHGATWTLRNFVSQDYDGALFADDGAGLVVAIVRNRGGNASILRSTDNGTTWAFSLDLGFTDTGDLGGLAYSPVWEQFMFVNPLSGNVYTSEDGGGWVSRGGFPKAGALDLLGQLPSANGQVVNRPLACVGPTFAYCVNMLVHGASGLFQYLPGVLYTFDLGTSWHFCGFGHPQDVAKNVTNIIALGGGFAVGSAGVVYVSDPIWYPDPDVTVA